MLDQLEALVLFYAELPQPPEVHRAGAAEGADHAVAQTEQVLGEIRTVLAGAVMSAVFTRSIYRLTCR
jgi:hypothetical protein